MIQLEICAASYDSAIEAMAGGADRIELCSALSTGGLTPSFGLIKQVLNDLDIPVHVLIRPREGNFTYTAQEKEIIIRDIVFMKDSGAAGIVVGCLNEREEIDLEFMEKARTAAADMVCTFHRAFDLVTDREDAIDQLIKIGFNRILTSGGFAKAWDGRWVIRDLEGFSKGKIEIMPGSGVNEENIEQLLKITGVKSIHSSAQQHIESDISKIFIEFPLTHRSTVKKLKAIISGMTI